jgi:hypothetical protein
MARILTDTLRKCQRCAAESCRRGVEVDNFACSSVASEYWTTLVKSCKAGLESRDEENPVGTIAGTGQSVGCS